MDLYSSVFSYYILQMKWCQWLILT